MQQRQTGADGSGTGMRAATDSPLAGYQPAAGAFDELLDGDGALRPAWAGLATHLRRLGAEELQRRWAHSQGLIHENAVAYSPHRGVDERPRPWSLDPLPLLLRRKAWRDVSAGLAQRARVLELTLRDLFGPQRLLKTGVLPADLLYAHPGYQLPLRREASQATGAQWLSYYAADLGRSPDGSWWVLADRTEAASGLGFALENRIVVSRMLSEPFRECRVRRLAGFFATLRETLESVAPLHIPNPRVAILSQGTGTPNYFEDAYLARYLGYTLVEAEDLTVRGGRLWLKTLEGLTPIDVLVRRPNTDRCDPLELGGMSPEGVAGLVQATRDGGVAVANAMGSGLVESPAFMAYFPQLCQALLDQPPLLPGVATWWCGDAGSLAFVLKNMDRLILKRAYRQRGRESLITAKLHGSPPEELAELVRRDPRAYIAQERVERSSAPLWRDGVVETSRLAMRAFAVARGEGYEVMDGALARTAPDLDVLETSILAGEGSKDVWIIGDDPVEPVTLLPDADAPVDLVRIGDELPSRVADHSFWLGRQMERADSKARLLRTVAVRLTGEGDPSELVELPPLLRGLAEQGQIEPGYAVDELRNLLPHVDKSLPSQAINPQNTGSLAATIQRVAAAATAVRDRLSRDAWRVLLRVSDTLQSPDQGPVDLTDLITSTDDLIVDLSAVGGMVVEGMTRTQFYRFLDIGRRLERASQLTQLLRSCLVESEPCGRPLLEALLETSDSLMTYRSRYRANLQFAAALDLLVTDESNPRSLAFQLDTLERHVGKLPRGAGEAPGAGAHDRLAMSMAHAVRVADVQALAESHEMGVDGPLAELLDRVDRELPALSSAISLKYLVHAGTPRQLSPR